VTAPRVEKAYEKYAWIIISSVGVLNPRFFDLYDWYFRGGGLSDMGFGFLVTVISSTAYRRGERWAWYTLWSVPVFFLGFTAITMSVGPSASGLLPYLTLFVILSLLGLLLPFRRFFQKGDKTQ